MAVTPLAMPAAGADIVDTPRAAAAARADPLAAARSQIKAKNWNLALTELRRVNASANADWNNLMGYALRKQATPDLVAAQRHYEEALRIQPRHLGANEYLGELHLIKGDLDAAESRLVALEQICSGRCEEYADLKQAISRFRANGNRYIAQ